MEFRSKTIKNYLKSIKKPGTLRLVPSKNSRKNSRFPSNKIEKFTKIVNRKPKINQKKLGHYEGYELILPKIMKKH